jgi:hypothetical protein
MFYKHHIIPRHAGGTDDPANIELVTLEEHAERHRVLWEQYGRIQDKCAWLLLSGNVKLGHEAWLEILQENGRKSKGRRHTVEYRQRMVGTKLSEASRKKMSLSHIGRKKSAEHKAKISAAMMGHAVSSETVEKRRITRAATMAARKNP